jgi:hypothetical protein
MSKPVKLAVGIGGAGLLCAALGLRLAAPWSWLLGWTALSCFLSAGAYFWNRPEVYGKRNGTLVAWRALPLLPFLLAFRISMVIRRAQQRGPDWHQVVPGLWVGARVSAARLPPGLELVVDLTSEWPVQGAVRSFPGYRCLPVLDGSHPPDDERFLALMDEILLASGGVYVHCEEGRGRAPTLAAAVLMARGIVLDVDAALELVRKARPSARPTRTDRGFLERIAPRLRG